MPSTFEKLNFKNQKQIVVLNAPGGFEHELTALRHVEILRNLEGVDEIEFLLAFVSTQREVDTTATAIARKTKGDAVAWFAYPKGTSKKYRSEISRDNGWQLLGQLGFEGVRGVAIDDDWSAIRFRRAEFIKTMARSEKHAMSAQGKARLRKN